MRAKFSRVPLSEANVRVFGFERVVVAYAGMGAARVQIACEAAIARGAVDKFVSVGFCGALNARAAAGTLHIPAAVIDSRSGQRISTSDPRGQGTLMTVERVLGELEKKNVASGSAADWVDMEAAHVARFANDHHAGFTCFKAVSDAFDDELPDLNRFSTADGQFETARFLRWVAVRPWWWRAVGRMGRHSARAAQALADALEAEFLR